MALTIVHGNVTLQTCSQWLNRDFLKEVMHYTDRKEIFSRLFGKIRRRCHFSPHVVNQLSDITVKHRQKDGTRIDVKCPEAVHVYNKFMGGVDKNDQLCRYYSVRMKSVKSYKYIFWFIFDLAVTNSYLLYQYSPAVGKILTLKEFRVELAKQLIGSYNSRKYRGRPSGPNSCKIHRWHIILSKFLRAGVGTVPLDTQLGTVMSVKSAFVTPVTLKVTVF